MQREITNTECKLYRTKYCTLLNMPSCGECFAALGEQDSIKNDLDVLIGLMPNGGVSNLFESKGCLLCKGENANKQDCYALIDMGHKEPVREKRNAIGIKSKTRVGSMVPLQIASCSACRRRMRTLDYLPVACPTVAAAIMLVLFAVPSISNAISAIHAVLPFGIFLAVTGIGAVLGMLITKTKRKEYAKVMHLNVMELPTLREMGEKGWFPLNVSRNKEPRLIFVNKRMRMGVATCERQSALFEG